mgnify:CR=1 FL=1
MLPAYRCNGVLAVAEMARAGLGLAAIPAYLLRDGDGLRQAIDQLGTGLALADADATEPAATACEPDPITRLENRNLLTVGYVEANAALRRTESRGAHARTDYPESCDEWAQSIAYINA